MSPTEPKDLRTGWTTGTCASAAAKAAAILLVTGKLPSTVEVDLPAGQRVTFAVNDSGDGGTVVVKDAGDDPDCTDGAHMTVHAREIGSSNRLVFVAGSGIGTVTKPGLGLPVGSPSISPVPARMITQAVREVTDKGIELTFSVPGGETMAERTTNGRLGIVGGISILGTTGIVRPFSTAAYRASVVQQINVAFAQGERTIVLATGSRSEKFAMDLFPALDQVCFVEVGDFTGVALKSAAKHAEKIIWVGMIGKISKLANEVMMTHFHRSDLNNQVLLEAAMTAKSPQRVVTAATSTNTARHFFEVCVEENQLKPLEILCKMAKKACLEYISKPVNLEVVMVDFDGMKVVARA
ncbi:MAG: cobalt-precorrin-5B (C(1))-methyltransferase [Acidimicrobiaceae bacterium]|nr:cobalt-precorrin-5B (C(1))-methyltransferase [Acidimicrobiaceae bacterium]